jgi:hypothetical protein
MKKLQYGEHHDPNLVKVSTYFYQQEVDQKIAFIAFK